MCLSSQVGGAKYIYLSSSAMCHISRCEVTETLSLVVHGALLYYYNSFPNSRRSSWIIDIPDSVSQCVHWHLFALVLMLLGRVISVKVGSTLRTASEGNENNILHDSGPKLSDSPTS